MPLLRVGLAGYGRIAERVHFDLIRNLPRAKLVAVAETDPARREEMRRRAPGIEVLDDTGELLRSKNVDAVVVALPNALHAQTAIAAIGQSKHVYLEKPLAVGLEEARQVMEASRSAGTTCMIGFNYRFHPLYIEARRRLRAGGLGALVAVRTAFSSAARDLPAWKQSRSQGGGALLDLGSHHLDLMRFLLEREIEEVSAFTMSGRGEQETAVMQMRLTGGLPAQSFFSLGAVDEDRVEIYGAAGKLTIDRYRSWSIDITPPRAPHRRLAPLKSVTGRALDAMRGPLWKQRLAAPGREPSFGAALEAFVAAVLGEDVEYPGFIDGYRSLKAIHAAEVSSDLGRAVRIHEDSAGE
ncbi:MAG: Gfo/Idh/MocA family protein [Bryobacteraceae bacterium]